jgi:hypothetical protein
VISGGAGTQVQLVGKSATVRSVTCAKGFIIRDVDLVLTGGNSTFSGYFSVTNTGVLRALNSGTIVTVSGNSSVDGDLRAETGAAITLSALRSVTNFSYTSTYLAEGEGSVLLLPALTNLSAAKDSRVFLKAYDGGKVDVSAVTKTANGIQAYASDPDSEIDLSGLSGRMESKGNHPVRIEARDGGSVILPGVTQLDNAELYIGSDSLVPTAQLTLATNSSITVDGAEPDFSHLQSIPDTALTADNGGVIRLPAVTRVPVREYTIRILAQSAGSSIDLSSATALEVDKDSRLFVEAYSGGTIDLHAVTLTTNAVQVFSHDPDSLVDLTGLSGRWVSKGDHDVIADARDGGAILIPNVTQLDRASLFIKSATIPTAQLTLLTNSQLTVEESAPSFAALKDIPDTDLTVNNGGVIRLPLVSSVPIRAYTISWTAQDTNSLIELPATTYLNVAKDSRLFLRSYDGGVIDLRHVNQTINGVQALAYEPGSSVNLSGLSGRWESTGSYPVVADARDGGLVLIPNVTEMANADLVFRGVGRVSSSQLVTLTNCSLLLYAAAPDFSSLKNIPDTQIEVQDGGVGRLTNVTQVSITEYTVTWKAQDPGSLLDLSSVRHISVMPGSRLFVQAYDGGRVDLSGVRGLTTGALQFLAQGTDAVIDLTGLSSFITFGNYDSELVARQNGTILFNDQAFLLSGVRIEIPEGDPVLPATLAASSDIVLHGKPWRSYWIDKQYISPVESAWTFAARVPLTNSFQPFTVVTPTNVIYRITEFTADPPIVDPIPASVQGKFGVVLYGAPLKSYQMLSSVDANGTWSAGSTVQMTNTFRIFPPVTMTNSHRFYRAKRL